MNQLSIISYCIIQNNAVYKKENLLYKQHENSLESLLEKTYSHFEFSYPKFYKMDNLSKLGWLASDILLKDENINQRFHPQDISIVLSNSNASLDADIHYSKTINEIPSPALFVYTLPNIVIGEIAIRNGFKGENSFFVSDKFNAGLLYEYVHILFASNAVQACICGWVDVLDNEYKCALFLIQKRDNKLDFTIENLNKIFNAER